MTAKERRAMRKLEIRAAESEALVEKLAKQNSDLFFQLYEQKCALLEAYETITDALRIVYEPIRADPQFMAKKKEIEPNF